jgi:hypothetical protein
MSPRLMKTRAIFDCLGFKEDWEAITDQRPAYYYDFGNLRLTAAEVMGFGRPRFHFGGVWRGVNSMSMVDFEMPVEVESLEQGAAWIAYGIGESFRPLHPTPWLADGRTWQDHLPWVRRMEEYKARPTCSVEKEWFKVAAKKLRPLADVASASDLLWFAFDGEALRIAGCGVAVILPATGTAWDLRYAIKGTQLDHLPTRLPDPVVIAVWEGTLSVGRRVWTLAQSEQLDPLSSAREPNVIGARSAIGITEPAPASALQKGDLVSRYKVIVVDNFNDMDEDERYELGTFSTLDEAFAACKQMVDEDLREFAKGKNYTPDELYDCYTSFGSDPFIVALDPKDGQPSFSAWNYAKERSQVVAGAT